MILLGMMMACDDGFEFDKRFELKIDEVCDDIGLLISFFCYSSILLIINLVSFKNL